MTGHLHFSQSRIKGKASSAMGRAFCVAAVRTTEAFTQGGWRDPPWDMLAGSILGYPNDF